MREPVIWWVSRDLRLQDNGALRAALAQGPVLPVFFIDRLTLAQGAASRWRLERGLRALDTAWRQRTGGQGLMILRGEPDLLLPQLAQAMGSRQVHQSDWPSPPMRALQARVHAALQHVGARLDLHAGHLLAHPRDLQSSSGTPYRVYSAFARALNRLGADAPLAPPPARIVAADAEAPALRTLIGPLRVALDAMDLAPDLYGGRAGLERFALPAGEEAAFARLDEFLDRAGDYSAGRDRPDLTATSEMSEALACGEISPRSIWSLARLRAEMMPELAPAVQHFLSELVWREFAWHLLIDFPRLDSACWRPEWQAFPWRRESPGLTRWQRGQSGVALVDAGLRQMWLSGRMHNRVRMVVASWLTKHQLTDWRAGLAHFADCLTDWDPAANAMNWQWVAGCGPDAAPYFRIFNPDRQKEKFDPEGRYCHRWLMARDEADLWATSIPPDWGRGQPWQPGPASEVTLGREKALSALADFRATRGDTADPFGS